MDDFIFGSLSSAELCMQHVLLHCAGVTHADAHSSRESLPGRTIVLDLAVNLAQSYGKPG